MSHKQNKHFKGSSYINRWNDVITTSTKTMRRLPIYDINYCCSREPSRFWFEYFSDLIKSERKISSIVIRKSLKNSDEIFEIFLSVKGANIRHFSIAQHNADFRLLAHLVPKKIALSLKFLPNLEHLELKCYNMKISENVTMNKLKSLKVIKTDLLKFIERQNLRIWK